MRSLWSLSSSYVFKPGLISLIYRTSSIVCCNFIVSIFIQLYFCIALQLYNCIVIICTVVQLIIQCNYIVIVLYLYSYTVAQLYSCIVVIVIICTVVQLIIQCNYIVIMLYLYSFIQLFSLYGYVLYTVIVLNKCQLRDLASCACLV